MAFQKLVGTVAVDVASLAAAGPDVGAMGLPIPPAASDGSLINGQTAVNLADGRVLLAGALDPLFNVRDECFILDPATGKITQTGSLPAPGTSGTMVLHAASGKVLYSGGFDVTFTLTKNAFLFDPATGKWTTVAQMGSKRGQHTLTDLGTGKILAAGGANGVTAGTTTCELFTVATGTWAATGAMTGGRGEHFATKFIDGTVMVVGGHTAGFLALTTCEIYSPGPGTWAGTGALNEARTSFFGAKYADDTVLVAGGLDAATAQKKSAETYDFGTGTWTLVASMNHTRVANGGQNSQSENIMLADGRPMVVDMPGTFAEQPPVSCEVYNITNDEWKETQFNLPFYLAQPTLLPMANGNMLVLPQNLNPSGDSVADTLQIGPARYGQLELAHGLEDFNGNGLVPTDVAMQWATDPCDDARVSFVSADTVHFTLGVSGVINGAVGNVRVWRNHSGQEL